MNILKKFPYLFLIFAFLFVGCESLQQRLDKAEKSVNDAERVNANKYAPDEIKAAANHLQKAKVHKASGLDDQAEISVKNAKKEASKAYFKSLNEFVKSQNNLTDERMKAAQNSSAEALVPDKFSEAKKLADQVQDDLKKVEELQKKLKELEAKENKE